MMKRSNGPVMAPRRCGARTNPVNARHVLATTLLGAVLAASCTGVEEPPAPELRGGVLDDEELEAIAREAIAAREGVEPDALELVTQDAVHLRHSGVAASAFKFIDGPSRRWLAVTLVEGEPVDAESLLQAEEAARAALHGRLDALAVPVDPGPPARQGCGGIRDHDAVARDHPQQGGALVASTAAEAGSCGDHATPFPDCSHFRRITSLS